MTTLTHTLTGIAAGKNAGTFGAVFAGIAAANFPDLNVIWKKDLYEHHKSFTHYPVTLLIVMAAFIVTSLFATVPSFVWMMLFLWALHLFLDSFGIRAGLHLFKPLTNREYSFTKLNKNPNASTKEKISTGVKNGQFLIEGILIFLLLIYIIFY